MSALKMTAVILAGGNSSRMGQNKLFLPLGDKPIVAHLISLLQNIFTQIVVVTDQPALYHPFHIEVKEDVFVCTEKNSLTGIHAGLIHAAYEYTFVVAGDMPFLKQQVVKYLCSQREGYDVVVPVEGKHYQPLCAVYHKNCLPFIEGQLKEKRFRIVDFFADVRVRTVDKSELFPCDPDSFSFFNINTPQDYQLALRMAKRIRWEEQN